MRQHVLIAGLAAIVTAASAQGRELTLGLHDGSVVEDGNGAARYLFGVDSLTPSDRVHIERATLTVPFGGSSSERVLQIRVCPLSGPFQGGGDWNTPFEEDLYARFEWDLGQASGTLRFDLTQAFRSLHARGIAVQGFVLAVGRDQVELTALDLARLSGLEGASLRVTTRNLPTGMPPQAWRERHAG